MASFRLALVALLLPALARAQVSKALLENDRTHDDQAHAESNKYIGREKVRTADVSFATDATSFRAGSGKCAHGVELLWHRELKSSVYSTPVLEDLGSDGRRDVLATTYVRYVEALEGLDGERSPGWPLMFDKSGFHSSPVVYDVDGDGHRDAVIVTTMGEIVFVRHDGVPFQGSYRIPPLPVKRNWYGGLDENQGAADADGHSGIHGFHSNKAASDSAAAGSSSPGGSSSEGAAAQGAGAHRARTLLGGDDGDTYASTQGFLPDGAQETWELFAHDVTDPPNLRDEDPANQAAYPRGTDTSRDPNMVYVTPHVITTPVIADLDGDGSDELIVAVTYYFGKDDTISPEDLEHNERDTKLGKYVAGGLVVFDLGSREIKWSLHLDLSTDIGQYRAYIFSAPNVADLDGDGKLEVVLGTSLGFVYVVDHRGKVKKGFPVAVGEMEGHVAIEDLDGDGMLDLVVVDFNSNVVLLGADGREKWERRISGFAVHGATIGDVDGDGSLDVVIASHEGHIWALRGKDGTVLPHFPAKVHGKIYSPVLLTKLTHPDDDADTPGLQLIVMSFDGHMYIFDGATGCVEKVDIGEHSYSMVLADDVTGNGMLDLVVSTMNGNVYAFSTRTPFDPLASWTSANQGRNGHTARVGYQGIKLADHTPREIIGATVNIQFEIVDTRAKVDRGTTHYNVKLSLGGKISIFDTTYTQPGTYLVTVPCPATQASGTLLLEMTNEHGQYYSDSVHVAFNLHFYRVLKWVLVAPFAVMATILIVVKTYLTPLPTTI